MVRDRINAMALEAGMYQTEEASGETLWVCDQEELERFAALVSAAEREQCAKVCDEQAMRNEKAVQDCIEAGEQDEVSALRSTAWKISVCAAAIRSRGQP
jgi:hypothetical protein